MPEGSRGTEGAEAGARSQEKSRAPRPVREAVPLQLEPPGAAPAPSSGQEGSPDSREPIALGAWGFVDRQSCSRSTA